MIPITIQSQDKGLWRGTHIHPDNLKGGPGIYCDGYAVGIYDNVTQRDFIQEQIAQAIDERKPLYRMPSPEEAEKMIYKSRTKHPEEAQQEEGQINPIFKKLLPSIAPSKKSPAEPAITYAEQTWGRPLTGPECENIIQNLNAFITLGCQDPNSIIKEAIKKADLQGIRTMKYIDSMLREWQKKKLITIIQIQEEDERFQKFKDKNKPKICDPGKYDDIYLS